VSTTHGTRDGIASSHFPATTVTDANGRFYHVSGAYAIEQLLFPTVESVNPTGLVLTRRVAEAIIARIPMSGRR
jgi:hypothetical protein